MYTKSYLWRRLTVGTKLDTSDIALNGGSGVQSTPFEVDGLRVGMIQLFDQPDAVEVGEIQIQRSHQNEGIGSRVLQDTIARVHEQRKKVLLSVAVKNERA